MLKNNPPFPSDLRLPVLKEGSRQWEMQECKALGWDIGTAPAPPAQALALSSSGINNNFAGGSGRFTSEPQMFSIAPVAGL